MNANDLKLGDTLTLDLWKLRWSGMSIRPDLEGKSLDTLEKTQQTFTIVGVLACKEVLWGSGLNENSWETVVYVPESLLPAGYGVADHLPDQYYDAVTSFRLRSAADQDDFELEYGPILKELGWMAEFEPTGWPNFEAAVTPMLQSSRVSAGMFGILMVLTLLLVAAIYTLLRRKELALLQSHGMSRRRAVGQALIPALLFGILGIGIGALAAYRYGMAKSMEALSGLETEHPLAVAYSPFSMALWGLAILAALLLLTYILLRHTAARPILEQLQGQVQKIAPAMMRDEDSPQFTPSHSATGESTFPLAAFQPQVRRKRGGIWSFHFLIRRVNRQWGRNILTAAVAVACLASLAYLQTSMIRGEEKINQLYDSLLFEGQLLRRDTTSSNGGGFLLNSDAEQLEELGCFSQVKKVIGTAVNLSYGKSIVNRYKSMPNPNLTTVRQLSSRAYWGPEDCPALADGSLSITFLSDINTIEAQLGEGKEGAIVSTEVLEKLGAHLGDEIKASWVTKKDGMTISFSASVEVIGTFVRSNGIDFDVMFSAKYLSKILDTYNVDYTYSAYSFVMDQSKNRTLGEFQTKAEEILGQAEIPVTLALDDSELRQAIEPLERNLNLLRILYPVMQILAVLLAAGLAALLIMQSAKDAAILRVLGVRRRGTALLLTAEQVLLALLGLIVGVAFLQLIPVLRAPWRFNAGLYLIGALAGAALSSLIRVSKNPLELLQVKE